MRLKTFAVSALVTLLLATGGCLGAAADDPLPPPQPSPRASVTPLPAFAPFDAFPDKPVFEHGAAGSWYPAIVEPGAVVRSGEQTYMYFNGLDGWPAKTAVGLAVSGDGVNWELASIRPLLDAADESFEGFTFFVSTVIELEGGEWAMYLYTLAEGRDGAPGAILMATAPAVDGPWRLESEPVLLPGEKGAWDGSRVTQPYVLFTEGEYRMYFSGYENDRLQGGRWIGLATSPDGYNWSKRAEPVLEFSDDPRAWDSFRVFQPRVLAVPDGYLLFYKSNVSVGRSEAWGFALSADGIEWVKIRESPAIDFQEFPIEWRRTGMADIIIEDGSLVLYLEILEREGGGYHHGNAAYRSNIFRFTAPVLP